MMKKKILLVEDTPTILKMAEFRLRKADFEVVTAQSGEEALEIVDKERPDLMLLDYGLPGIDGAEVCRRFKSDERLKRIPIIIFSATLEDLKRVKEFGADDGILKPYESEGLIAKIKEHL
ncbi:MAG: response regulator [Candidatus Omnitrophota bacterium]|nr:response regulator [Candidatus Omnitrophota bacterium]